MKIEKTKFLVLHILFFSAFLLPQFVLNLEGSYFGKLNVYFYYDKEFYIGLVFVALYFFIFVTAANVALSRRIDFRKSTSDLEKELPLVFIVVSLTILMYFLLFLGFGFKQTNKQDFNFIILFLPREFLLVVSILGAIYFRKNIWLILLLVNASYWFLTGSKAAIFLIFSVLFYIYLFSKFKIRAKYVVLFLVIVMLLPISFVLPKMISGSAYGHNLYTFSEIMESAVTGMAKRISWLDGLFLNQSHSFYFSGVKAENLLVSALARLIPGVAGTSPPLALQVVPLHRVGLLEGYAGAIGVPGVLKMTYYANGFFGLFKMSALFWAIHFSIFKLVASRNSILAIVGFASLIISTKSLVISGNIDTAVGKIMVVAISTLCLLYTSKKFFKKSRPKNKAYG